MIGPAVTPNFRPSEATRLQEEHHLASENNHFKASKSSSKEMKIESNEKYQQTETFAAQTDATAKSFLNNSRRIMESPNPSSKSAATTMQISDATRQSYKRPFRPPPSTHKIEEGLSSRSNGKRTFFF